MKTSNMVKLSLVIVAVAFTSTVTGYIFGVRANDKPGGETVKKEAAAEIVSKEEKVVEEKPQEKAVVTQSYLLKDNEGYIALYHKFSDGQEKLYKEYDIAVNHLPQSDRDALKEGIEVESLSEALQLIEDYM